jgi:hypothetical protein
MLPRTHTCAHTYTHTHTHTYKQTNKQTNTAITSATITSTTITSTTSNAIEKGSQNNVFVQFEIEVDGNFGPYEMCNPMHGWDTAHWECLT